MGKISFPIYPQRPGAHFFTAQLNRSESRQNLGRQKDALKDSLRLYKNLLRVNFSGLQILAKGAKGINFVRSAHRHLMIFLYTDYFRPRLIGNFKKLSPI